MTETAATRPLRSVDDDTTFFFVHVMKTGGSTFVQHLNANFPPGRRYPVQDLGDEHIRAYYQVDYVRRLEPEVRDRIRIWAGHFPFAVSELVGADVTLAVLRDPVERTVSFLRHCKRYRPAMRDLPLEAIYEDSWLHPTYIRNYQAKLFAMTTADKLESHLDVVEVDDARLATAKANVERVDVLGLHERYDDFVAAAAERFGWRFGTLPDLEVSTEDWDVPASFRRRIAEENAADLEFFDHARAVHDRQRVR